MPNKSGPSNPKQKQTRAFGRLVEGHVTSGPKTKELGIQVVTAIVMSQQALVQDQQATKELQSYFVQQELDVRHVLTNSREGQV